MKRIVIFVEGDKAPLWLEHIVPIIWGGLAIPARGREVEVRVMTAPQSEGWCHPRIRRSAASTHPRHTVQR
jgi:hypothetical protein